MFSFMFVKKAESSTLVLLAANDYIALPYMCPLCTVGAEAKLTAL